MKQFFTLIIFFGTFCTAMAQSTDSLQVQLARKWTNSKSYALKLAALMPEKDYEFRATDEEMTFTEQVASYCRQYELVIVHLPFY